MMGTVIFELVEKIADKVILRYLSQLLHRETEKIVQKFHSGDKIISRIGTGHLLI
jgi:hypothetical protein